MKILYSIGEFSQVTGLSVKTLRFYHEKGFLIPDSVDQATGYRFYAASKIEKARVVMRLRQMEFSIEDIATVFAECADDADILNHLERQRQHLQQRISEDRDIVRSLSRIITSEKEAKRLLEGTRFAIEEKSLEPMLHDAIAVETLRLDHQLFDLIRGFGIIRLQHESGAQFGDRLVSVASFGQRHSQLKMRFRQIGIQ